MSNLPFTLDQLRILSAISNEGSFKKAAEKLYISQPAVSLQVQNLERQLKNGKTLISSASVLEVIFALFHIFPTSPAPNWSRSVVGGGAGRRREKYF